MNRDRDCKKTVMSVITARLLRLVGTALCAAGALLAAHASWAGVAATKHNLGSLSSASVKSPDTTEVCVFCHTPHNADPAAPIWNKSASAATYNPYESESLAATISPNPLLGQPTGSSKLCLTCHDGTIALGTLINLPGADEPMGGTVRVTGPNIDSGKINASNVSYIGVDLRNDHPISFDYSLSYPSNTEINPSPFTPSTVKLSNGKVECTSCHDPHGTSYTKFLTADIENGTLCSACHDKRYWTTMPSIHKTSTATWNQNGTNPWYEDMGTSGFSDDTPAVQSCMSCHRSHGGPIVKSLLKENGEETTCLNCHNGNVAAKDINTPLGYASLHDVKGYSSKHVPSRTSASAPVREKQTQLDSPNRHAECSDCHNPHAAKSGNHTVGGVNGNIIGNNILGSWGVKPNTWPSAGTAPTTYTVVDFTTLNPGNDNLEGYLCIKCHSYYAYANSPPYVPSGNADDSAVFESDPTADFNINNYSYHPVFAAGKNTPPVNANANWYDNTIGLTNTFNYGYNVQYGTQIGLYQVEHTSTITCTDCHGSDVSTDPAGPHGSNQKWILRKNETGSGSAANFCYNCHRRDVYGDEDYDGPNANFSRVTHPVDGASASVSVFYRSGADTGNNGNKFGILCMTCHGGGHDSTNNLIKSIHGSAEPAGTQSGSDPLGYRMMNGACVESYTRPSTTTNTKMWFRTVTPSTDTVCNRDFSVDNFTNGNTANYNCNTIADCSN